MAQQTINVGTSPNDGTGTPLRTAFQYTNSNFSELYTALGGGTGLPGATTQVIFNDGGTNLAGDAGLVYNKTTDALTIGGNVQAASATITGDLTVATDRLKVNTGSTAVQIGATTQTQIGTTAWPSGVIGKSGSRSLFGNTGEVIVWNEASPAIGNYSVLFVGAKTGSGATTIGGLQIRGGIENASNQDGFCELWTSNNAAGGYVKRATLDSSGNLGLGVTPSASGGVLQLKSGITFPATQVASSDANTLDDYEEGTWTPVVADASSGGNTGTCTINSAKYTKIGRVVSVECDISGIQTTGMTAGNALNIRGLPFSPVNGGNGSFYTYRVGRNASTVSSSVYAPGGVTALQFYLYTTSSATTDLSILVSDIVSGTSQIIISVTYTV